MALSGGGYSNALTFMRPRSPLNGMALLPLLAGVPQLAKHHSWYLDLASYTGPNTAGEAGGWLLTETAAGGGNVNRVDLDDSRTYGALLIKTDNGDNDLEVLQLVGEPFRYVVGQRLWYVIRVETNDADDGEMFFGLAITDTSPIASAPGDGLYFSKTETGTRPTFAAIKNGAVVAGSTVANVGPILTDNTAVYYAFTVSESGQVDVYAGTNLHDMTHYGLILPGNANLPNDEDLAVMFAVQTGAADSTEMRVSACVVDQEVP